MTDPDCIRVVNKRGGAIAPPYFGSIEGAAGQRWRAALLLAPPVLGSYWRPWALLIRSSLLTNKGQVKDKFWVNIYNMTCFVNSIYVYLPSILILITMIVCDKVAPAELSVNWFNWRNTHQELISVAFNSTQMSSFFGALETEKWRISRILFVFQIKVQSFFVIYFS